MTISLSIQTARLVRHLMLMAAITLFGYSNNAWAESTEIKELKLEVATLKKRIQELESTQPVKIPEVPTDLKNLNAPVAPETPNVKTKKTTGNPWQSLQVNLSKAEVTSLLGKPGKIDKWKTGEAWYFPNPRGGEIDFNASDSVTGWLEP
jgi:hypothetical protein